VFQFPKFHSYKQRNLYFRGHVSVSATGNKYEIIQHHTLIYIQYL
jgi:hypothetical protein